MRHSVRLLLAALLFVPGCRSCRDASPPPPRVDAAVSPTDSGPAEDLDGGRDVAEEANEGGAAPIRTARPPQLVAQRFVVGFASGRLDDLDGIVAERAAEVLQRARAGEVVDCPLGRLEPDRPAPRSFGIGDLVLAEIRPGVVRVAFTLTATYAEGPPVTTGHVLVVRVEDGVVLDWTAPAEGPAGGV